MLFDIRRGSRIEWDLKQSLETTMGNTFTSKELDRIVAWVIDRWDNIYKIMTEEYPDYLFPEEEK